MAPLARDSSLRPRTRSSSSGFTTSPRSKHGSGAAPTRCQPIVASFLPRQRIFFTGNITKPIEYELAINRGSGGTINVLNAFINVHFDDRFELRLGRFFTPLTYDQYAISNYWLPTPERSLFTTNVGLGRQIGVMAWGYLFDKRLDYAAGVFNGSRNSFESLNNALDFVAFLNTRPFQQSESLRVRQIPEPWYVGRVRPPGPVARARVVPHRRGLSECRRPRGWHDAIPDPQPRRDRARRPVTRVRPRGLFLQGPVADRRVAVRLRQLRVRVSSVAGSGAVFGLLRHWQLFPNRRARRAADTSLSASDLSSRPTRAIVAVRAPGKS